MLAEQNQKYFQFIKKNSLQRVLRENNICDKKIKNVLILALFCDILLVWIKNFRRYIMETFIFEELSEITVNAEDTSSTSFGCDDSYGQ